MPFEYSIGYRKPIMSKELNDRIDLLIGKNVLVEGFNVTPIVDNQINISPGIAIISGCIITEHTDNRTLTIPTGTTNPYETINVYLEYRPGQEAGEDQCTLNFAKDSVALSSNTLLLAKVKRTLGVLKIVASDITMAAEGFVSMTELKDIIGSAKLTDTVTTINGKTGAIKKEDIVALGIPAQDTNTTYGLVTTSVNGLMTAADKIKLNGITDTVTTINGKTGAISKADIVALGIPASDTNTVYTHPGTGTNPHNTTKSDVGLSSVTNDKQMPISGGILENYREKLVTLSGTSTAINLSLGNVFTHNLTGNTTYTISNAISGQAHSFTLQINMDNTVRTLTFPSSVKWQGGEIPDLNSANKMYVLTFMSTNGGSIWLGMFGGEFNVS